MSRPAATRLPWQPIADAYPGRTVAAIAHVGGRNESTLRRWRDHGIPIYDADRIACRLGVHPCQLWPDFGDLPDHVQGDK